MSRRKSEIIFLLALLVVGVAVFYGSWSVRVFTQEPCTAKTYGCFISGLLIVTSLYQIIRDFLAISKKAEDKTVTIREAVRVGIMLLASIFYCFGIANIGYYTCTYIFLLLMLIVLTDARDIKHIICYALGTGAFCYLLSVMFKLMQVYMPNTPLL